MFWDSIPEHPLPGTPFQNILYLGLRSRTRTEIKGHAVSSYFFSSGSNTLPQHREEKQVYSIHIYGIRHDTGKNYMDFTTIIMILLDLPRCSQWYGMVLEVKFPNDPWYSLVGYLVGLLYLLKRAGSYTSILLSEHLFNHGMQKVDC